MSIYPVKLVEWYPPGDKYHSLVKWIISTGYTDSGRGCVHCKKKHLHWQEAIGHHSLPWGYGDLWCRQKCYKNYWKKRRIKI